MNYEVCKYGKEWAIFDRQTRCYVLFSKRKKDLVERCKELNKTKGECTNEIYYNLQNRRQNRN